MSTKIEILQKNSASANKLNTILRDFYIRKIRGKEPNSIKSSTITELDSILKHFMIESYSRQATSLNDKFDVLPFYDLSEEDHAAINNAVRVIEDKFYFKIKQVENRNQGIQFGDVTDISLTVTGAKEKQKLDPFVYIQGVATAVIFGGTNLATKIATQLLFNKMETADAITALDTFKVKWVTKGDDLVCEEFCKPLEDQLFDIGDPNTPIPINDTHIHCRCILVLVKG
jgi:hypothetical protein